MASKTIGQVVFVGVIAGAGGFLWWYDPQRAYAEEMRRREALIAEIPVALPLAERLCACLSLPSCEALDAEIMNLLRRCREQGQLEQALARAAGEGQTIADGLRRIYDRFNKHGAESWEARSIIDDIVVDIQTKLGLRDPPPPSGLDIRDLLAFFLTDPGTPREHLEILIEPLSRNGVTLIMPPLEDLPRTAREVLLEHMKRKRAEEAARGITQHAATEPILRGYQGQLEASLRP